MHVGDVHVRPATVIGHAHIQWVAGRRVVVIRGNRIGGWYQPEDGINRAGWRRLGSSGEVIFSCAVLHHFAPFCAVLRRLAPFRDCWRSRDQILGGLKAKPSPRFQSIVAETGGRGPPFPPKNIFSGFFWWYHMILLQSASMHPFLMHLLLTPEMCTAV